MQTIKKYWVTILFVISLIFFVATRFIGHKQIDENKKHGLVHVTMKPIQLEGGWGYEIYANDSLYIRQDVIPAVSGRKLFVSKEQAEKIGNLVVTKLVREKVQLPSITVHELDSCGITLK
jgi:hypothetical protein